MSTNAHILAECDDGYLREIYVHWDGDKCLPILKEYYDTQEKVEELINLGNLSTLAEFPGNPKKEPGHSFEKPKDQHCISYWRDRGEDLEILEFSSKKDRNEFVNNTNYMEFIQYMYYWNKKTNKWKKIDVKKSGKEI